MPRNAIFPKKKNRENDRQIFMPQKFHAIKYTTVRTVISSFMSNLYNP